MRINLSPIPKTGDIRQVSGFLLLPKRIERQVRWLEFATWREIYVCTKSGYTSWVPMRWIDD